MVCTKCGVPVNAEGRCINDELLAKRDYIEIPFVCECGAIEFPLRALRDLVWLLPIIPKYTGNIILAEKTSESV